MDLADCAATLRVEKLPADLVTKAEWRVCHPSAASLSIAGLAAWRAALLRYALSTGGATAGRRADGHAFGIRGSGAPDLEPAEHASGEVEPDCLRETVAGQAQNQWASPVLLGPLKAIIINFHDGNRPSVDVDNMSKPILDVLQSIVYSDDRQIRQAQITHLEIGAPFSIVGVSKIIVNAIQAGTQFVYIRIEDPADPFPLPK